ncbi:MAG: glycosyltransferase family 4 protein [Solirubrobacteraceae bacterium]
MTPGGRRSVLVITPDFPPASGGIQVFNHRIVAALEQLEPTVVTLAEPGAAGFDARQPFAVRRVRMPGPRPGAIAALNARAVAAALRRRPDVVLSAHIVAAPAAAALRRHLGVPFAQCFYADEIEARPALARFAATRADRIVAISAHTRELVIAAGADPQRVVVIHPGVDLPPPGRPPADRDPAQPPTVLTISRLQERYKGHDVILRALPLVRAKLPRARWRIVGDGPLRPMLEARSRALGLDLEAVSFLGRLTDEARDAELDRADVMCMVSRVAAGAYAGEGFGIAYLEAGAHRLPVVAGAAGGALDAVTDDETGILVDPEDHVAVAEALVAVLTDRRLAARLGAAGRARAQRSGWAQTARRVERELRELVA